MLSNPITHLFNETMRGSNPSFNALPVELKQQVLQEVQNLDCLEALIKCSSIWHKAYLAIRSTLLPLITLRGLSEDGADPRDALAAAWSSTRLRTTEHNYQENTIAFLDKWRRPEETRYFTSPEISLDESIELIWLRRIADRIIEDVVLEMHRPGDVSLKVSGSERRRLRRAIYRWHLHCNLFHGYEGQPKGGYYRDSSNHNAFDWDDRESLFFAELNPWESEEVVTITEYAERRYEKFLGRITAELTAADDQSSAFMDRRRRVYLEERLPGWPYHKGCQVLFEDKVAYMPVLGPGLLHQILNTDDHGRRTALLIGNVNATDYSFSTLFTMMVALHRFDPTTWHVMWRNQTAMLFEGDENAASPNMGWVMAKDKKFTVEYAIKGDKDLRQVGYVMWDSHRFAPNYRLEANTRVRLP